MLILCKMMIQEFKALSDKLDISSHILKMFITDISCFSSAILFHEVIFFSWMHID